MSSMVAAIRVRGQTGVRRDIKATLRLLRLYRRNYCVDLPKNSAVEGMLRKAKDYITWGDVDEEGFRLLIERRGEEYKGRLTDSKGRINYRRFIEVNGKKIKPYFRLMPPRQGFERKGIKKAFSIGGALGFRGEKIKDLIMRMI